MSDAYAIEEGLRGGQRKFSCAWKVLWYRPGNGSPARLWLCGGQGYFTTSVAGTISSMWRMESGDLVDVGWSTGGGGGVTRGGHTGTYMKLSGIVWITGRHANGTAVWHTEVENPHDGKARNDAAAGCRKLRMSVTEGRRKSGLSFRVEHLCTPARAHAAGTCTFFREGLHLR